MPSWIGAGSSSGGAAVAIDATGTPLSRPLQPNALWCADFKGEFQLTDRRYCFPLTDHGFREPVSDSL